MLSSLSPASRGQDVVDAFERDNARIYADTDWALDISAAEFEEFDIRNVPADLIRRDSETQVIVRRERVAETEKIWRNLDLAGTPWALGLTNMLAQGLRDKLLVAPKRRKDFDRWLSGLRLLQREGIAE